ARLWPAARPPLVTSNHVIDELATSLGRLAGFRYAADRVDALFASAAVDVLQSTRQDELDALRWMRKYADQRVTFTDCVSFAIMRRHQIRAAVTFDRHFKLAGFEVIVLK